ncbi:hypothetical protein QTP88_009980 [Uroleucon formosanum]
MSSSSKTNTASTKQINKTPLSPLILVKTKIPQNSNKSPNDFSDNDDIWQTKNSNKRIRSPLTKSPPYKKVDSNIFLSKNRFAPLMPTAATENENETQHMETSSEQPTDINNDTNTIKISLPPPIFIEANLNYNTLCLKLKELTDTSSFVCKSTTKGVKIQTFSSDSYRSVIKFLKEEDVSFHSYQSKENKPFRIVIRNLHPSTDKKHISKELSELGFQVKNITSVLHKSTKTPLPLFFVDLEQSESNQDIFKLTLLCYSKVKVETPHTKKEIPQCQRCQSYGHTRSYCFHNPRCVRCGNNHESTQCQKDRSEPAKCALCSGSHPANYRGCQIHKDLLKYRKLHLNPSQRNKKVHQFSPETNTTQEIPNSQNFPPLSKTPTISIPPGNHSNHWSKNDIPPENNLTNQLSSFINELNLPNHFQSKLTNLNDPASDHTPVLIQINASISSHNNNNSSKIIWPRFRNIMSWNTNLNNKLKSHADIDKAISTFTETILIAKKNASVPLLGPKSDHLITPEIRQLITEKRRARNRWQYFHYPEDRRKYNSLSNKLKSLLKTHKNELYKSHLASLSPNNGSLWKKTKSLLRQKETLPPLLRDDNSLAIDDQDKADLLASHLADSFKPHSSLTSQNHIDLVETYLISPLPMALPAKHTTPAEVSNIIKNLKNNKSPGHDQISNKIIKNLPPKSIIWLTYIFNALLRLSYFPPTWKNSIIITILKPGKPSNSPSSYRPISLLPAFGKMFEKIILKRLLPIVQKENILPDIQFGFRSKHSTNHQLHRVTDFVSSALESKKYCAGVFLDVAKAFDTVWHHGLLFKLKKTFSAPYYLLLKSYLENRSFRVRINTRLSTHHEVQAGVPQGSDIAPFLYIFYTADIPVSQFTLTGTYADDTAILASSVNPILASHQIQTHLNILIPWFNKWGIKINETKSSHITFSLRPHDCPPIIMNNSTIPHCTTVKYLGLTFDRKLTWGPHLKDKRKQLNSRLHLLRPLLRSNTNIQNKILIYKCLLRPLWTYGIILWGPTKKSNAYTIQAFQSICLRIIAKAPWYVTNKLLHDDLQIKTVQETATNFYKRFHGNLLMNHNHLISQLASKTLPDNPTRRLKRSWCRDLLNH